MLDEALAQFEKWGIKGVNVDFMQRDDQKMVQYYYNVAKKAAEHKACWWTTTAPTSQPDYSVPTPT